jgi:DNA-binding MarR family transcriptional regulator
MPAAELDAVTDAALLALRAFVGIAVRSVEGSPVTLAQYRALALLAERGPQSAGALASLLDVDPSTVTRTCDRLVEARMIKRHIDRADRRSVTVALTASGVRVVEEITHRRRAAVSKVLRGMPPARRAQLVNLLGEFATAAHKNLGLRGEPGDAEFDWSRLR